MIDVEECVRLARVRHPIPDHIAEAAVKAGKQALAANPDDAIAFLDAVVAQFRRHYGFGKVKPV
jgi:hypothetical protein